MDPSFEYTGAENREGGAKTALVQVILKVTIIKPSAKKGLISSSTKDH